MIGGLCLKVIVLAGFLLYTSGCRSSYRGLVVARLSQNRMRLSKIKLSGFKSFVDPTTIAFPGNLMGIVGPNGCGKSNIIDAIRWVLGEGSAKTLRGDSMADVIFNGSAAVQGWAPTATRSSNKA